MKSMTMILAVVILLAACSTTRFDVYRVDDTPGNVEIYYTNKAAFTGEEAQDVPNVSFYLQFEKKAEKSFWYIVCEVTGLQSIEPPMTLTMELDGKSHELESERMVVEHDGKQAVEKVFYLINSDTYSKIVFADRVQFRMKAENLDRSTWLVKEDKVRFNLFKEFVDSQVMNASVIYK